MKLFADIGLQVRRFITAFGKQSQTKTTTMWQLLAVCLLLLHQGLAQSTLWRKTSFNPSNPLERFATVSNGKFGVDDSLSVVNDPAGGSNRVLRVFYKKGSYSQTRSSRGAQFYSKPISGRDSMTLSYDIYFSPGFDFVKGGKLPGLFGGGYTCSGGRKSEDCFSTRFMWRASGDGEVYVYQTRQQAANFCSRSGVHCDANYGNSLGRGSWRFTPGKWHSIAQHVRLNTPGSANGLLKVWLDGKLVFSLDNVAFISKSMKIDGLFFSTFFGGGSSSWAASKDSYTFYKNFVFSSSSTSPVILG